MSIARRLIGFAATKPHAKRSADTLEALLIIAEQDKTKLLVRIQALLDVAKDALDGKPVYPEAALERINSVLHIIKTARDKNQ